MPVETEPFENVDRSKTYDPEQDRYVAHHPADRAKEYVQRGVGQVRDMATDNLGKTIFAALGAGFAVGLLLSKSSRRGRSGSWADRITAEGVGRKILGQLDGVLPDALSERLKK